MLPTFTSMHYTSLQYFYHADHLGSASWITDADGNGYQHLQYLPFGESWVEQRLGSYDTPYQFSGKEKDEETGYNYFGARYYDSELSVWLSVDPMSDKYPSLNAFDYCGNSPIMLYDPDGTWIPQVDEETGKIYIEAEEGDDYNSLVGFFGSRSNAEQYVDKRVLKQMERGRGFLQILFKEDNPFSEAISDAYDNPADFAFGLDAGSALYSQGYYGDSYNCYYSVQKSVTGEGISNWRNEITNIGGDKAGPDISLSEFKSFLINNTNPAKGNSSLFGQSILTFGDQHAAIFFGKSRDGSVYVFTKNGAKLAPTIMPLADLVNGQTDHPYSTNYGSVRPPTGITGNGYYNVKR
jgi:RHS repeat-associated protein